MSVVDRALLRLLEKEHQARDRANETPSTSSSDPLPTEDSEGTLKISGGSRNVAAHGAHTERDRSMHVAMPSTGTSSSGGRTDGIGERTERRHRRERRPNSDRPRQKSRKRRTVEPPPQAADSVATTENKPVFVPTEIRFDAAHGSKVRPTGYTIANGSGTTDISAKTQQTGPSVLPDANVLVDTPAADRATADATAKAAQEFKPSFEVDHFVWPQISSSLLNERGDHFDLAARHLLKTVSPQSNVVAVTRLTDTRGTTTVALCLARALAAMDKSVLVVDTNVRNPTLAKSLQIANSYGWNSDFDRADKFADALINSLEDRVVIAPWITRDDPLTPEQTEAAWLKFATIVREHFDVILVDAAPIDSPPAEEPIAMLDGSMIDHAIVLQGDSHEANQRVAGPVRQLVSAGVKPAGIVRNQHLHADNPHD